MHRVGIIPFDTRGQAIALLFVTSQTRGRWILPKGRRKSHESQVDTCHREGFEEAGLRGIVLEDFPITTIVTKQTDRGKRAVPVTYYPFLVTEQADDWPEKELRERHWALIEDAPRIAYHEDFLSVVRQFEALRSWIIEVAEGHKSSLQEEQTRER